MSPTYNVNCCRYYRKQDADSLRKLKKKRKKKDENSNLKRYMNPSVHSSTIYNSQDMEAT